MLKTQAKYRIFFLLWSGKVARVFLNFLPAILNSPFHRDELLYAIRAIMAGFERTGHEKNHLFKAHEASNLVCKIWQLNLATKMVVSLPMREMRNKFKWFVEDVLSSKTLFNWVEYSVFPSIKHGATNYGKSSYFITVLHGTLYGGHMGYPTFYNNPQCLS